MGDWQEIIALGLVAAIVAFTIWYRRRKRRRAASGCGGCQSPAAPPKEAPLKFHRRRR